MRVDSRYLRQFPLALVITLAGCQPAKQAPSTPPPVVSTIMPQPPLGSAAGMEMPDQDDTGRYITPNRNMVGEQALWHVRMALNVAALGCRSPSDQIRIQYNQMLHIQKDALKSANDAVDVSYKQRYGANAVLMREKLNTIVYNFFALPPAQKAFCEKALAVGTIINGLSGPALIEYAPKALQELEQPFQDFWADYAEYLRRLEEWRRLYGRPSVEVQGWAPGTTAPPAPINPAPKEQGPPPEKPSDMIM